MKHILAVLALAATASAGGPALAQDLGMSFDDAAYVTCREAQAMPRQARIDFALALVNRASAFYGVPYTEGGKLDDEIGTMLRAGCTVFPDAYVQAIAALAVRRAGEVPPNSVAADVAMPFESAVYMTCEQYGAMTTAQQDAIEYKLAVDAGRHYGMRFEDTQGGRAKLDEGITPLVYGTCALLPEIYVYAIVARSVQAAADQTASR